MDVLWVIGHVPCGVAVLDHGVVIAIVLVMFHISFSFIFRLYYLSSHHAKQRFAWNINTKWEGKEKSRKRKYSSISQNSCSIVGFGSLWNLVVKRSQPSFCFVCMHILPKCSTLM
jgi:hypothetical protein